MEKMENDKDIHLFRPLDDLYKLEIINYKNFVSFNCNSQLNIVYTFVSLKIFNSTLIKLH